MIYMAVMEKAVEDGYLSLDEGNILDIMIAELDLNQETVDAMIDHFDKVKAFEVTEEDLKTLEDPGIGEKYASTFKAIVKEALKDEQITREEFALINTFREITNIAKNDRQRIYNEVRTELIEEEVDSAITKRAETFLFN